MTVGLRSSVKFVVPFHLTPSFSLSFVTPLVLSYEWHSIADVSLGVPGDAAEWRECEGGLRKVGDGRRASGR